MEQPNRVEKFNQAIRGTVTLILVLVFCYLAILDKIDAGLFATTVTMVVSFWFATRGGQGQTPSQAPTPNGGAATPAAAPEVKP